MHALDTDRPRSCRNNIPHHHLGHTTATPRAQGCTYMTPAISISVRLLVCCLCCAGTGQAGQPEEELECLTKPGQRQPLGHRRH